MSSADQVALRLFSYPAWKAEVNGRNVKTSSRTATGQMLVPVEAGMNRVEIHFARTWDRTLGDWISFLTLLAVLVWVSFRERIVVVQNKPSTTPRLQTI
jgi:hypothetical protein